MDKDINLQFFHYCYEGDIYNAKQLYYENYPYLNISWKKDKIFRFCCKSAQDMYGYNDIFTNHAKKLIIIIKFLSSICNNYSIKIENDKLIEWKIQDNKIIITI
jgi:hypothetical protein